MRRNLGAVAITVTVARENAMEPLNDTVARAALIALLGRKRAEKALRLMTPQQAILAAKITPLLRKPYEQRTEEEREQINEALGLRYVASGERDPALETRVPWASLIWNGGASVDRRPKIQRHGPGRTGRKKGKRK